MNAVTSMDLGVLAPGTLLGLLRDNALNLIGLFTRTRLRIYIWTPYCI